MVGRYCIRVPLIGLGLAIDPPPQGDFVDYDFLILHYISHKNEIVKPSESDRINV